MTYISAFLTENRKRVKVWSRDKTGSRVCKEHPAPYYFYMPDPDGTDIDMFGNAITRVDFNNSFEFFNNRKILNNRGIRLLESDVQPDYKVLSDNYHGEKVGELNISLFDIEVDYDKNIGYSTINNPYAPISAVAIYHWYSKRTVVLAVPPDNGNTYTYDGLPDDIKDNAEVMLFDSEKGLLRQLIKEFENSDIISGWNSDFFDVPYVYERLNITLHPGAGDKLCFPGTKPATYREVIKFGNPDKKLVLHGRISLDFLDVYKNFEMAEKASYALAHIADEELPDLPKLSYSGSLYDLYTDDFNQFLRYNIRDTEILKGLEEKKGYIHTAIELSHMVTSRVEDVLGTIKVSEMAIMNHCHYDMGCRVYDRQEAPPSDGKYSGATVIEPKIGMYEYSASTDLTSLYPSVMRALNISPETIIGQFINKGADYFNIIDGTDAMCTMRLENGQHMVYSGRKWKSMLPKMGYAISGLGTVFDLRREGVIPSILTAWFSNRKRYKKLMGEAYTAGDMVKYDYYNRMQYIIKIMLNSMYGACGNEVFKFYDVRLAESTTLSGREVLYHMARTIALKLDGKYDMDSECIIYGDTDSVYFKTYKDNADDALALANSVCDTINESYPPFMRSAFFCDDAHDKLMGAEQEIVSDRGIYIKKKYYMLHLVYDDGKKVDSLKFMGVPIKKTTLPKHVKTKLSSFIGRILAGEDWEVIGPEVVYYKDELEADELLLDIGLPKGVNKVEVGTLKYESGDIEQRKSIAGHCRASILWNKCLKEHGDLESQRIMSGSKIFVFYLQHKIDGYFTSIAIPKDLHQIPDWFMDNYAPIIDRKAQTERLVEKPMAVMINAAGLEVPTKKKIKFEEIIFG